MEQGQAGGQKAPLKLKEIWAIRVRLRIGRRTRESARFNLAIDDRKLRSCDLVRFRVSDVCHGNVAAARAIVMQQNTRCPVQFEITEQTRDALPVHSSECADRARLDSGNRSRGVSMPARAHTLRRTNASLIYRRTKNLRVVQLLLGHAKLESTVLSRTEVDDAVDISE